MLALGKDLTGVTAPELVNRIARVLPPDALLEFIRYTPRAGADERAGHGAADPRTLVESASDDALERTVREMLRHEVADELPNLERVPAGKLDLEDLQSRLEPAQVLAWLSRISRDAQVEHLPMLDMKVSPSDRGLDTTKRIASGLGIDQAIILQSGASYHVYGRVIVSELAWKRMMTKALLAQPFVDARYVAHRLLAGHGVLRLTASSRKPTTPFVVHPEASFDEDGA